MVSSVFSYYIFVFYLWRPFVNGAIFGFPAPLKLTTDNQTINLRVMLIQREVFVINKLEKPLMNCALYCDKTCVMFAIIQEECRLFSKFTLSLPVEPYTNFQQGFRVFPQAQIPREKIASVELLVFRQDSKDGIFWPSDLVALNKDNPTAPRYSILDELDDFRATDGHFHFKMCYPELHNSSCYRWSQSENPLTIVGQTVPKDFMYKEGPFPITQHFKGLSRSTPYFCILDADLAFPGLWWFPIGTYAEFASPNTFPGPMDKIVSLVELFLEL